MCKELFCYLGDTLDVDGGRDHQKWLDEVPITFSFSDTQSSPAEDERSSVCHWCQKQHKKNGWS